MHAAQTLLVGFQATSLSTFGLVWCSLEPNLWGMASHTNQSTVSLNIFIIFINIVFINIWFAIRRLNKYILYRKGFLKACRPPNLSNVQMKGWSTWNTHVTNLNWYMPKANVDDTISGQETTVSTLDHSHTRQLWCLFCRKVGWEIVPQNYMGDCGWEGGKGGWFLWGTQIWPNPGEW